MSFRWVMLVLVALLGFPAAAQTPEELFNQANAAYESGDYQAAADGYRSLLRYRIEDPILQYNLANAEYRLGHLGRSILHYERAHRLDPVDPEILANLQFARSQRFDRVERPPESAVVVWVRSLQNRVGPDAQAWVLLLLVWLVGAVVAGCFARPRGWNPAAGWTLAALLLAVALVGTSWYATLHRLEDRRTAVVLIEVAEVLAGPGYNNAALFTVHEGLTLEIRSERDEWLQVSLPNGLNGWISRRAVEEV